jgi:hypothetical protein
MTALTSDIAKFVATIEASAVPGAAISARASALDCAAP